jgi:hypothetical protein
MARGEKCCGHDRFKCTAGGGSLHRMVRCVDEAMLQSSDNANRGLSRDTESRERPLASRSEAGARVLARSGHRRPQLARQQLVTLAAQRSHRPEWDQLNGAAARPTAQKCSVAAVCLHANSSQRRALASPER